MSTSLRSALASLVLLATLATTSHAATFGVNSPGDQPDGDPGDGLCSTGLLEIFPYGIDFGCTLRAAMMEANANTGRDTIEFTRATPVPGSSFFKIRPTSPLPLVIEAVSIFGTTAPGYADTTARAVPLIEIDGSLAGPNADGLRVSGGSFASIITGLAIHSFAGDGIQVDDAQFTVIARNFIGLTEGTRYAVNGGNGVRVNSESWATIVGATPGIGPATHGNVISGNELDGIRISGQQTLVADNQIGTAPWGRELIPDLIRLHGNGGWGVRIDGAVTSFIGEADWGSGSAGGFVGNLVSGNLLGGLRVEAGSIDTHILGTLVGTDAFGFAGLGNGGPGMHVSGTDTTIGDTSHPGSGNLVSGNEGSGIEIGSEANGVLAQANGIGVDASHFGIIPNGRQGIDVVAGSGVVLLGNTVGGNAATGIALRSESTRVRIEGNSIGTNSFGSDLGNAVDGIWDAGLANVLGSPGRGNLIARNGQDGIDLASTSVGSTIEGNYIGTNASGSSLGNASDGIEIRGRNHVIGGVAAGSANVIGFNRTGVRAESGADANSILGNFIGTNEAGAVLGNVRMGIDLGGATHHIVGGAADTPIEELASRANVIAHNGYRGVEIDVPTAFGNAVRGNEIYENGHLGLDLGAAGFLANDLLDSDEGANRFQNHPEFSAGGATLTPATGALYARYSISSDVTRAAYPLTVDFYLADLEGEEPMLLLGSDVYPREDAGLARGAAFVPRAPLALGDRIVAVATDADNNTSESSPSIVVPEPSGIVGMLAGSIWLAAVSTRGQRRTGANPGADPARAS